MRYVFDLDGTLCSLTDGQYESAKPFVDRILQVNNLYDAGHHITIFTARGMGRNDNCAEKAYADFFVSTHAQLTEWGLKFHELMLGKSAGDIYVDDKAMNDTLFFESVER